MRFTAITALLALAATAFAAPEPIHLPVKRFIGREAGSLVGRQNAERERISLMKRGVSPSTISAAYVNYTEFLVSIGVGTPPTYYNLILDTGSSNTWVGAGKPYVITSSSVSLNETVGVIYGLGNFTGPLYNDTLTLAPGVAIKNQSLGDGITSFTFKGTDGVIGLGTTYDSYGSISGNPSKLIPTPIDQAYAQGLIPAPILGVSFAPASSPLQNTGSITFGGVDKTKYLGDIVYTNLTRTYTADVYWGINITGCYLVLRPSLVPPTPASSTPEELVRRLLSLTRTALMSFLVDIYLASDWFAKYSAAIPGSYLDGNGAFVIPQSSVGSMKPFTFIIGDVPFILDVEAQLIPQSENAYYGYEPGLRYGVVNSQDEPSGGGNDWHLGAKFMERYYAVFDTINRRVGFAYTAHTFST